MNMNLCPWGNSGLSQPTKFGDVFQPIRVVALADAPGPYSATFPSSNPYGPVPRHRNRLNLLFLGGNVHSFDRAYVGCASGDPRREDVRWLTGTDTDQGIEKY
jgi:prepilin-type processing-associated H-X9-DG protein